MSVSCEYYVVR